MWFLTADLIFRISLESKFYSSKNNITISIFLPNEKMGINFNQWLGEMHFSVWFSFATAAFET